MWSPRQLAELAGTSRRTVRYYDEIGLLPKPERDLNGYGKYGVDHLIRLLRIRRLTELGLSLPQISSVGDADRPPEDMMRDLDVALGEELQRIQQARAELSTMLSEPGPIDLPAEVERRMSGLPEVERRVVVVLNRLLDRDALAAYLGVLGPYRDNAAVHVFDRLDPEASAGVCEINARELCAHLIELRVAHPVEMARFERGLRRGTPPKQRTVDDALQQLYNPAQWEVLRRLRVLHRQAVRRLRTPGPVTTQPLAG